MQTLVSLTETSSPAKCSMLALLFLMLEACSHGNLRQRKKLARGAKDKEFAIGFDIGKISFHIVAHDERGAVSN